MLYTEGVENRFYDIPFIFFSCWFYRRFIMSNIAKQIVDCLYSNEPSQITQAFNSYTPELEGAVKEAFEERSEDLKEISFSSLPINSI